VIYLTFDVGYENGNVAKIMDVMKEEGVKGTFFILGNVIEREAELVKRMINEGHVVANHTLTHKNLAGKSESAFLEEIEGLEKKYKELTGKEISKFFRPPEGTFDQKMLEYANKKGYKTVFWSFAYADWDNNSQMSEKVALKKILDNVHNGEIMLLHPTSATNAKIMKNLIKELKSMGYCFATLEELE
jgi:peptidoglycan-N-acetylmuramic acid deacetylase